MDLNAVRISFNGSKIEDVEEFLYTYVNVIMIEKSDKEKAVRIFGDEKIK